MNAWQWILAQGDDGTSLTDHLPVGGLVSVIVALFVAFQRDSARVDRRADAVHDKAVYAAERESARVLHSTSVERHRWWAEKKALYEYAGVLEEKVYGERRSVFVDPEPRVEPFVDPSAPVVRSGSDEA